MTKPFLLSDRFVLLIITGGIAAYKSLDLIRRLKDKGANVDVIMTRAAQEFITPLSVQSLTHRPVFSDLFDRHDELDVGHIRLARQADLVIVAPATAHSLAKTALGLSDDLATTVLAAHKQPVLFAPAMNPAMWHNSAIQAHVDSLTKQGHHFAGPQAGAMAEAGEEGTGRLAETEEIIRQGEWLLRQRLHLPLKGRRVLITAGPTEEALDPIRYISNRSSGQQGYALAEAAWQMGADVTLVSGPVHLPRPGLVDMIHVRSAEAMFQAVDTARPCDIGIFCAAVSDWRPEQQALHKMKKGESDMIHVHWVSNRDILSSMGHRTKDRPALVIGFAAETENMADNARRKCLAKKADWIIANNIKEHEAAMGGKTNQVMLVTPQMQQAFPVMDKLDLSFLLLEEAAKALNKKEPFHAL
jgi:phosphopantothenoylcysteine decarboxylase/phosphopantothenate--cysteine ligase